MICRAGNKTKYTWYAQNNIFFDYDFFPMDSCKKLDTLTSSGIQKYSNESV